MTDSVSTVSRSLSSTSVLAYLCSRTSRRVLNEQLFEVAERTAQASGLDASERQRLIELSRLPEEPASLQPTQHGATVAKLRSDLEAWLGTERYRRYLELWGELYANALLQ